MKIFFPSALETHYHAGLLPVAVLAALAGFGIGFVVVHMQAKCMAAAAPGEESITASSLSTVRSLGQAFGSAIAGTIANIAGLELVASKEAVAAAATGVYLFDVIPLALATWVLVRYYRVERARSTALASGDR